MQKTTDSALDYEAHATEFLRLRDGSDIGATIIAGWAASLKSRFSELSIEEGAGEFPSAEVLEVACGGGLPVTRELINAGVKLWAIDSSPTLLQTFTNRFPGVEVRCESALESRFFDRTYHGVLCIGLIFMLSESGQKSLISRVANVLRPGGSFLFSAPLQTGPWTDVLTGTASLSLGENAYRGALADAGFDQVSCFVDQGENNYYEAIKASE